MVDVCASVRITNFNKGVNQNPVQYTTIPFIPQKLCHLVLNVKQKHACTHNRIRIPNNKSEQKQERRRQVSNTEKQERGNHTDTASHYKFVRTPS